MAVSNDDTCALLSEDQTPSDQTCMNCMVRRFSLFDDLNVEELATLDLNRSRVSYKAGEYIYKQGTRPIGLICLSRGKVKITTDSISGTEQIIALRKPVDFLGFTDLMGEDVHFSSAIAMEETEICFIPLADFMDLVKTNLSLALKIIKQLINELTKANQRTADLTQKHMRARLADALLYVLNTYGTSEIDNVLNVDLKRSDLAGLSNMTTANAIRTLSEFVKSDLVGVDGRKIKIKNLQELENISLAG
ncbi:MAG: Crp/Fnr family transcriptional regulator [Saprospiraceae bacterium]|nr:Crp/Fnr family transcriptional regulator [Saprospiraceae bacterium]